MLKVNLVSTGFSLVIFEDLNTSHVKVNHKRYMSRDLWDADLNTSHVKVNLYMNKREFIKLIFKYISC